MYDITRYTALVIGSLLLSGCQPIADQAAADISAVSYMQATPSLSAQSQPATSLPWMVYVYDTCFTNTGRTAHLSCAVADGSILTIIPSDQRPSANGQANFDEQDADYIHLADGALGVRINEKYLLFLADDTVEYNGIYKKKNQVSQDTLKWLDFYYSLSEDGRNAISMIPTEFVGSGTASVMETDTNAFSYLSALSQEELQFTENMARWYFTEKAPAFEGVEQIYPADDDYRLYQNTGIESEYGPGNIIIYMVQTIKDKKEGNPMRSISIARNSKADDWKVINSGY